MNRRMGLAIRFRADEMARQLAELSGPATQNSQIGTRWQRCRHTGSATPNDASLRQEVLRNFLTVLAWSSLPAVEAGVIGWWRAREWLGRRAGALGCEPDQVMHGWANYFRHAVAKNTFAMLDNFAWWRVIRMLRERHRWGWKDIRGHFTTPQGRWLPITAGEIELRRIAAIPVTRYRYRGTKIPNPWAAEPA